MTPTLAAALEKARNMDLAHEWKFLAEHHSFATCTHCGLTSGKVPCIGKIARALLTAQKEVLENLSSKVDKHNPSALEDILIDIEEQIAEIEKCLKTE